MGTIWSLTVLIFSILLLVFLLDRAMFGRRPKRKHTKSVIERSLDAEDLHVPPTPGEQTIPERSLQARLRRRVGEHEVRPY